MPALHEILAQEGSPSPLFAIVDGAAVEGLPNLLDAAAANYRCLYRGELDDDLNAAAPYLLELDQKSEFGRNFATARWGHSAAVFVHVSPSADIDDLRRHFRKLNRVKGPAGEDYLFRYYDPRVLRVFLPTCDGEQLAAMFDDVVLAYVCEGEGARDAMRFVCAGGTLARSIIPFEARTTS